MIIISLELVTGCSVYMAAKQPTLKDMSVFGIGTKRDIILAELGNPVASGKDNDAKYDIFSFIQGYTAGSKAGRAFLHGTFDVLTLGLWEVLGTPIESVASGDKVKLKVIYDSNDCVKEVINLAPVVPPISELPQNENTKVIY